jgi:hypothetical protein
VFFLLRACLWIGAIILLVPMLPQMHSGGAPAPAASAPTASTVVAVASGLPLVADGIETPAAAAVAPAASGPSLPAAADIVGFCLNNGAVCEAGFSVVAALGDAVGQGLELAATLQHGETAAAPVANPAYDPPPIAVATVPVRVTALPAAVGTLTAADRAEPWLGDAAGAATSAAASALGLPVPPLPVPDPRRRPAG